MSRKKYHSFIAYLYINQKEKLLPADFRQSIPYSTISTWRSTDLNSYKGNEFCQLHNQGLDWVELFLKYKKLKTTVLLLTKVWISLSDIFIPVINKNNSLHERIINEMQRLFTGIPKEMVFKITGISAATFHYRLYKLKLACKESPLSLCFKKHPLQLSLFEISTIKELFYDQRFICWPVSSIAHYARRHGYLQACVSTWYKYIKLLGLKKKSFKPAEKNTGIQSSHPNQFLHVDTTFWTFNNGMKRAIVFVSDNFSKNILGWSCSPYKSAENVKQALIKAIDSIRTHYPDHLCANLVADGGSENHAVAIKRLLEQTTHPDITKIIALKDISFSNSPAEAINKIMKRYLRQHAPQTDEQLYLCLQESVQDYIAVRPHGTLNGMTPLEVYTNTIPDLNFSFQTSTAKKTRIQHNKSNSCGNC